MSTKWALWSCLLISLWLPGAPTAVAATPGDIALVIEGFMARQFPESSTHFWVVNGTQWQTENEVVVDLNTVVTGRSNPLPTENRFLLLIVEGKLAAAQNIPLDSTVDCQPDQA